MLSAPGARPGRLRSQAGDTPQRNPVPAEMRTWFFSEATRDPKGPISLPYRLNRKPTAQETFYALVKSIQQAVDKEGLATPETPFCPAGSTGRPYVCTAGLGLKPAGTGGEEHRACTPLITLRKGRRQSHLLDSLLTELSVPTVVRRHELSTHDARQFVIGSRQRRPRLNRRGMGNRFLTIPPRLRAATLGYQRLFSPH